MFLLHAHAIFDPDAHASKGGRPPICVGYIEAPRFFKSDMYANLDLPIGETMKRGWMDLRFDGNALSSL